MDAAVSGGSGAVVDAYPQFQYDAANTATGDTAGPDGEPSAAWAWPADPGESPLVWEFAAAGSTVFATRIVGEDDRVARVVALDAKSGEVRWQRDLPEGTGRHSQLAVAGGSVYLIAGRTFFSLDAATGETEWSVDHDSGTAAPVVAGDTLYTSDLGTVYAFATGDGSQLWSHTPEVSEGLMFAWTPAVRNGHVYVGAEHLQALSPEDGSVRWSIEETFDAHFSTASVVDGVIYTSFVSTVDARSTDDGSQLWSYTGDSNSSQGSSHPMVVDGYVYFRDGNRQLVALSA